MQMCRDKCPYRVVGCHAQCEYYQERKAKHEKEKKKQRESAEYESYRKELFIKNAHYIPPTPPGLKRSKKNGKGK